MTEEGYEVIEVPLPCLITVVKEINSPRLPSLKGKMKAKSAKVEMWNAKDIDCDPKWIGLQGSPTKVVKIFTPPPREKGKILQGEGREVASELANLLKDEVK